MPIAADDVFAAAPFARTLGATFERLEAEEVRVGLANQPDRSTIGGGIHGGALMALADVAAAVCAMSNAPDGSVTTTAESTSYLLRPVMDHATAVARPLRVGRRLIVIEVDVLDGQGRLCGRTTQVQSVLDRPHG